MAEKLPMPVRRSEVFGSMLAASRTKFGAASCYPASEHYKTLYGIPLPNLPLRYLFTSNVLMLERILQFFGPKGSGKSSLCYELARIFIEAGGLATVIETENKTSYSLMRGIIGDKNLEVVQFFRSLSVEKAMDEMSFGLQYYIKNVPHKNIPYFVMWDSLVGSKSEETINNVMASGHASKNFPVEANILSTYFGTLPDRLSGFPITVACTAHEKTDMGATGPGGGGGENKNAEFGGDSSNASGKKETGGAAPGFYATYQIRVTKKKDVVAKDATPYMEIQFRTKKNNMGISNRSISARLYFYSEKTEDGRYAMRAKFDWSRSTMELLMGTTMPNMQEIKKLILVTQGASGAGYYNCQALKLKDASAEDVCEALYATPEIYGPLQDLLSIDRNIEFDAGAMTSAILAKSEKKTKKKGAAQHGGTGQAGDANAFPEAGEDEGAETAADAPV